MKQLTEQRLTIIQNKAVSAIIGALLYAILVWLTTIFPLAAAGDVNIRPGVVVPIFFGFTFGPGVGFFTGLAGNLLGDLLSGVVTLPVAPVSDNAFINLAMGTFLPWQIGNGLMGLIPGLARRFIRDYSTVKDYLLALTFAVLGIVLGMGFASLVTILLGVDATFVFSQYFIPAVWSNIYNVVFLLPILLYNYEYFDRDAFRVFRSRFMRRLLILILSSAGLPIVLLGLFLIQPDISDGSGDQGILFFKLLFTIALTLLFVIVNASMIAQRLSRLILKLSNAAQFMEADKLSTEQISELKETPGNDEISQLCRIFGQMAQETLLRQENMRKQIRQLHIKIDKNKIANEVAGITETDYFQQLERKADELRLSLKSALPEPAGKPGR
jgi:energy-coupling factor transport system substrate-specific component